MAAAGPNRLSYALQAGEGQPSTFVTWDIVGVGTGTVARLYVDEPDDLVSDSPGPEDQAAWAAVLVSLERVLAVTATVGAAPPS